MPEREAHVQEVNRFLQKRFAISGWTFSRPQGSGAETYVARSHEQQYFVKIGAPLERYRVMAETGLTPPVLADGKLESGVSILVQSFIPGRTPSQHDFQSQLERVATLIHKMHMHPHLQQVLPPEPSSSHRDVGVQALSKLRRKWDYYKAQVPDVAEFVDKSLDRLALQIDQFSTEGLVASHNDICNANWLFSRDGSIYLVDFESMSMDDPAFDMGALLWWYYPPEVRAQFLRLAGYPYNDEFAFRMRVRMALHCLNITLPREQSFDSFHPSCYDEALEDFRAIVEGRENPQGYFGG